MTIAFQSDIFVQLLKLNPRQKKHVIPCCFHPDAAPSLAIDLSKAVWYCHGACNKPKGGGPITFLIRWEKIKNGKTITSAEARKRLRFTFKIPSAQEALRQAKLAEIQRFAQLVLDEGAGILRALDRSLATLTAHGRTRPLSEDEWELLGILHEERRFWDERWNACHGERDMRKLIELFKDAIALDLWSDDLYFALRRQDEQRDKAERSRDYEKLQELKIETLQWATHELTRMYEGHSCHASPSTTKTRVQRTPITKRTPVLKRTPVPTIP